MKYTSFLPASPVEPELLPLPQAETTIAHALRTTTTPTRALDHLLICINFSFCDTPGPGGAGGGRDVAAAGSRSRPGDRSRHRGRVPRVVGGQEPPERLGGWVSGEGSLLCRR